LDRCGKEDYVKISENKWNDYVMKKYNAGAFGGRQGAYWYIGQIAHLTEDMAVPAHACYIPHGGFLPIFIDPLADLLKHCDQFEFCADFKINCEGEVTPAEGGTDPWQYPTLCRDQTRAKIQDVVMSQYWQARDQQIPFAPGRYGPDNIDIFPPYPELLDSENMAFLAGQFAQARNYALGMLISSSKKLPPVITEAKIGEDCLFHLKFQENRTEKVKVNVKFNGQDYFNDKNYTMKETSRNDIKKLPYESELTFSVAGFEEIEYKISITDGDTNNVTKTEHITVPDVCSLGDPSQPDENNIISTAWPTLFENLDDKSQVGILRTGFYYMTSVLLDRLGIHYTLVDAENDLSSALSENVKLLIVPSAGISLTNQSEKFKTDLDSYVNSGGTLIVFTQAEQDDLAVIPGGVYGWGYNEDINCFRGGSSLCAHHPVLSSEASLKSDVHLDGFFTEYPEDAEILLMRTSNSMPAMMEYDWGPGKVLVSSMYPDYAYWTGQWIIDEVNYVRDMVTWGLKPAELPEYQPGDSATPYSFQLTYPAEAAGTAEKVVVDVKNPDRDNTLTQAEYPINLLPGDTTKISIDLPALPINLGIWHTDVKFYSGADDLLWQGEELDGRFVVAKWPAIAQVPDVLFYMVQEKSVWEEGEIATFRIFIENHSAQELKFDSLTYDNWHGDERGIIASNIVVAAGEIKEIDFQFDTTGRGGYNFAAILHGPGFYKVARVWGQIVMLPVDIADFEVYRTEYYKGEGYVHFVNTGDYPHGFTLNVWKKESSLPDYELIFSKPVQLAGHEESYEYFDFSYLNRLTDVNNIQFSAVIAPRNYARRYLVVSNNFKMEYSKPVLTAGQDNPIGITIKNLSPISFPPGEAGFIYNGVTYGSEIPEISSRGQQTAQVNVSLPSHEFITNDIRNIEQYFYYRYIYKDFGDIYTAGLLFQDKVSRDKSSFVPSFYEIDGATKKGGYTLINWPALRVGIRYPTDVAESVVLGEKVQTGQDFIFYSHVSDHGDFHLDGNAEIYMSRNPNGSVDKMLSDSYPISLDPNNYDEKEYHVPILPEYPPGRYWTGIIFRPQGSSAYAAFTRAIDIDDVKSQIALDGMQKTYREGELLDLKPNYELSNFVGELSVNWKLKMDGVEPEDITLEGDQTVRAGDINFIDEQIFPIRHTWPGSYNVWLSLSLPNGQTFYKGGAYYLPPPELEFSLAKDQFNAGEDINVKILNSGGLNLQYYMNAVLEDRYGNNVASVWYPEYGTEQLAWGASVEVPLIKIPGDLASGIYELKIYGYDYEFSGYWQFKKRINITGQNISLDAWTDKDIYSTTENITGDGVLTAGGIGLEGTSDLRLEIIRRWGSEAVPDEWPMYRHDSRNTGKSELKALMKGTDDLHLLWDFSPYEDYYYYTYIYGTPAISDLNNDGKGEAVVNVTNGLYDPMEGMYYEPGLLIIHDGLNGEILWSGTIWGGPASPSIGDLEGDGRKEIVVGSGNGDDPGFYILRYNPSEPWLSQLEFHGFDFNEPIFSAAALYDLDGDGNQEIILQSGGLAFYDWYETVDPNGPYYPGRGPIVYNHLGEYLWTGSDPALAPLLANTTYVGGSSTPAVADIDGDGKPEIVVGWGLRTQYGDYTIYTGGVHAFGPDGSLKWSYHTDLSQGVTDDILKYGPVEGPVMLSDLENDGNVEVIFQQSYPRKRPGDIDAGLIVLNGKDGSVKWTSAGLEDGNYTIRGVSPAVGDANGDGLKEIFYIITVAIPNEWGDYDWYPALIGLDSAGYQLWPPQVLYSYVDDSTWLHDSPLLIDLDNDGRLEVALEISCRGECGGSLFVYDGANGYQEEWDSYYFGWPGPISFGDLNGDNSAELLLVPAGAFAGPAIPGGQGIYTEILWGETTQPVVGSGDALSLSRSIAPDQLTDPYATGELIWHGKLTNYWGQVLGEDEYPFIRTDAEVGVVVSTDKNIYKVGSDFQASAKVVNNSGMRLTGLVLNYSIKDPADTVIHTGAIGSFDLEVDPSQALTLPLGQYQASAVGSYKIEARVTQNNYLKGQGEHYFQAIAPKVVSVLEAPFIVGDENFEVLATVANDSQLEAEFNLELSAKEIVDSIMIDDFESYQPGGPLSEGWEVYGDPSDVWIYSTDMSGINQIVALTDNYQSTAIISRQVDVPSGDNQLELEYYYYSYESISETGKDIFEVRVNSGSTRLVGCKIDELSPLLTVDPWGSRSSDWRKCVIDLSGISGSATLELALTDGGTPWTGGVATDNVKLLRLSDTGQVIGSMLVNLALHEKKTIPFTTHITQDTAFIASYTGDYVNTDITTVSYGMAVDITAQAQNYYAPGPVQIPYKITSTGIYPVSDSASFVLKTLAGAVIATDQVNYSLVPSEKLTGSLSYDLIPDTYTLYYSTRGKEKQLSFIVMPQQGLISLSGEPKYPAGYVELSSSIANTGVIEAEFPTELRLFQMVNGSPELIDQVLVSPELAPGATVNFPVGGFLEPGFYRAEAEALWPDANQLRVVEFEVLGEEKIAFNLELLSKQPGIQPVNGILSNLGYLDFSGYLQLDTDFWAEGRQVSIPVSGTITEPFQIDLKSATPGTHTVNGQVYNLAGDLVGEDSVSFNVEAAKLVLVSTPARQEFDAGGQGNLSYVVANQGDQQGSGDFTLEVLEDRFGRKVELNPQQSSTLSFNFTIPDDIEEKEYYGRYHLFGGDAVEAEGLSPFYVRGVKVSVQAIQDKKLYCVGESMDFTLLIKGTGALSNIPLRAVISYNENAQEQDFVLGGTTVELHFNVPVQTFEIPRILYSIEFLTGRSIYINTQWVNEDCHDISLWTDKQVYLPDEDVQVSVVANKDGPTEITSLDGAFKLNLDLVANEEQHFVIHLPDEITAGTKYIYYTFYNENYKYPFDVDSYKALFKNISLDKRLYWSGDDIQSDLIIWVNRDFYGYLDAYVLDPAGNYTPLFQYEGQLRAGDNFVQGAGLLNSQYAGIHQVFYALYRDEARTMFMASTQKAFDVGDFEVVAVTTDKDKYEYGYEDALAQVWLYGKEFNGEIFVDLDDELYYAAPIVFDGYTVINLPIPKENIMALGSHIIKAELTNEELTSIKSGDFQVVDTTPPDIAITQVTDGYYYNSDVSPLVFISDLNLVGSIQLLNGNTFENGDLVSEENDYQLLAAAWDSSDNFSSKDVYFVVDKTAPSLGLPFADNSFANQPLTFAAQIGELHRDPTKEMTQAVLDGAVVAEVSPIGEELTLLNEGEYQVIAQATDLANNSSQIAKNITLDFTPPVIDVTGVTNGFYYNTDVTLRADITELHRDPTNEILLINGSSYPFGADLTLSAEASYLLIASAWDLAGNAAEPAVIGFTVDKSPPLIDIIGVADGEYRNSDIILRVEINDANRNQSAEQLVINGQPYPIDQDIILGVDGIYSLAVSATDLAGNQSSASISFMLDKNKPVIQVSGVEDGAYYSQDVLLMATVIDDNRDPANEHLLINGGLYNFDAWHPFSEEREYAFTADATDKMGNVADPVELSFTIDKTPPVLDITFQDGAFIKEPLVFTTNIAEANRDKAKESVKVYRNGALVSEYLLEEQITLSVEGNYVVVATATDLAGNYSTVSKHAVVDMTPPVITITGVSQGEYRNGDITLRVSIADANRNPSAETLLINGQAYLIGQDILLSAEASYTLLCNATDLAGNKSFKSISFVIDKTPPTIVIDNVVDGEVYGSTVTPVITVSDPHLDRYDSTLNGAAYQSGTPVGEQGDYLLNVSARDLAGNHSEKSAEFSITRSQISLEVSKYLASTLTPRLLVWIAPAVINPAQKNAVEDFLGLALAGRVEYHTVYSLTEFVHGMRSGAYNEILIINLSKWLWCNANEDVTDLDCHSWWWQVISELDEPGVCKTCGCKGSCGTSIVSSYEPADYCKLSDKPDNKSYPSCDPKKQICNPFLIQRFLDEARARTYSGDNFIAEKHTTELMPNLWKMIGGVFGLSRFLENPHTVQILKTEISKTGEIKVDGNLSAIDLWKDRATEVARYKNILPFTQASAILLNQYGQGISIVYGFDLSKVRTADAQKLAEIVLASARYQGMADALPLPGQNADVGINIKNLGVAVNVKVQEKIPEELKVVYASDAGNINAEGIDWELSLYENDLRELKYSALLGGKPGTYVVNTKVFYWSNGQLVDYGEYPLDVSVEKSNQELITDVISSIQAIDQGRGKFASGICVLKQLAIQSLTNALNRNVLSRADAEKNLNDIIFAQYCLELIDIVAQPKANLARLELAYVLRYWQAQWAYASK